MSDSPGHHSLRVDGTSSHREAGNGAAETWFPVKSIADVGRRHALRLGFSGPQPTPEGLSSPHGGVPQSACIGSTCKDLPWFRPSKRRQHPVQSVTEPWFASDMANETVLVFSPSLLGFKLPPLSENPHCGPVHNRCVVSSKEEVVSLRPRGSGGEFPPIGAKKLVSESSDSLAKNAEPLMFQKIVEGSSQEQQQKDLENGPKRNITASEMAAKELPAADSGMDQEHTYLMICEDESELTSSPHQVSERLSSTRRLKIRTLRDLREPRIRRADVGSVTSPLKSFIGS
ncbi:hypothetical protein E5288_WYG007419 [Bos mutus]|uniref:Uncharacterized protein n=1 Tax=Bos mutus TaxID=72004 RepID=A0A6B0S6L7_9CETA|nr:hypothetical protein [Bos mutus]